MSNSPATAAPLAQTPWGSPPPSSTAATDPLAQLRDIHLPAPIDWWPPAPGWWLLGGTLLIAIAVTLYFLRRRYAQQRYRRLALQLAKNNFSQWQQHGDAIVYLQTANQLLKQAALVAYPARQVAALSGTAWLDFLDSCLRRPQFNQPATRALTDIYQPRVAEVQPEPIQRATEYWLRRHVC